MANPENKQIPYESTQKDIRDAIESVATAIGGIAIPSADHVSYDNSGSGLSATDVQNAIDELSSEKADSSSLATVATSGDYDDLTNKPTIPTVNDATLTIQKNGSDVATFTANASSNVTANITVPTTTSELTNNSDFVSDASYVHTDNNFTTAEKTKLSGIESGAEVNVQSDWNQTDNTADDYIKNKPDIDGLIDAKDGENISDDEPYIFRQGKGYLADEKIIGASVVWIQQRKSMAPSQIINGITLTQTNTGIDVTGTVETEFSYNQLRLTPINITIKRDGSKYLITVSADESLTNYYFGVSGYNRSTNGGSFMFTTTADTDWIGSIYIHAPLGTTINLHNVNINVINLTKLFGSNIADYIYTLEQNEAGAGVAWFRNYFPNDYYAYDSGSLQSVCIESKKIYDADDNLKVVYLYDSSKELRGLYTLVDGELKADGDEYTSDGEIKRRYGIVDLGSLNWYYYSSDPYPSFGVLFSNAKAGVNSKISNLLCGKYVAISANNQYNLGTDKTVCMTSGNYLRIRDTDYTDATAFKTAMSGVYLLYELATPTYESADPYLNPSRSYPDGTEEFVDHLVANGTRDVSIPVGHETTYYLNKVINPSADYTDAMTEFKVAISTLGTNESGRTTASQSYASGDYFYKDGYMCKALTSISAGATLTLNTNYSQGTLADVLKAIENA